MHIKINEISLLIHYDKCHLPNFKCEWDIFSFYNLFWCYILHKMGDSHKRMLFFHEIVRQNFLQIEFYSYICTKFSQLLLTNLLSKSSITLLLANEEPNCISSDGCAACAFGTEPRHP